MNPYGVAVPHWLWSLGVLLGLVVVGLVAHGLQTKQVARQLGISVKTADRHIQNAYGKVGVSTRAAAALFAMQHGLSAWGELPIADLKGQP